MAISVQSGFQIGNIDPIDARFVVADQTARLGFASDNVYEGLVVYQKDTDKLYVLVDASDHTVNSNWSEIVVSGTSGTNLTGIFSGSFSGSFEGDGSGLTGIATELPISGTSGNDTIDLQTEALTFSGSLGFLTPVTANKVEIVPPQDLRTSASPSFAGLDINGSADIEGNLVLSGGDRSITATPGSTISLEGVVFDGGVVNSITDLTASNALFDDLDVNGPATISGNITLDGASDQTITNTAGNLNIASTGTGAHVTVDGVVLKGGTVTGTTISGSLLKSSGAVEGATLDISGDGVVGGTLTVDGDLIVSGETTTLNTSNLLVEDKYILLNSGSSNRSDSGIIFGGADGVAQSGSALIWDASYNSDDGRLAVVNTLESDAANDPTPDYYVAGVYIGDEANAATAEADHQGNIRIDGSEIFIYV